MNTVPLRLSLIVTISVCLGVADAAIAQRPAPASRKPAATRQKPAPPSKKPAPSSTKSVRPLAARVEQSVPFAVGEALTYDVSWSNTISAGTATLRVQEKRPSYGSVAYYIVAEAQPGSLLSRVYTLYYKADSLLDAYSLLPQRGSLYTREGKRQRMKITQFDHGAKTARFQMQTASIMVTDMKVPGDAHDLLSAIYALRASPAMTGDRLSLAVSDSGQLYNVEFAIGGRENVAVGSGTVPGLRVSPTVTDESGTPIAPGSVLWISDDARRVPLRLETQLAVGRFVLALK